jgi:hypothetical protein
MKCPVCGHKHNEMKEDSFELNYTDTEPFKQIKGHFTLERDYGYSQQEVYLVACPECNTILLDN